MNTYLEAIYDKVSKKILGYKNKRKNRISLMKSVTKSIEEGIQKTWRT
jgi:hypothetical protein